MGNDQSRPDGRDHLQVVTLPNDIPEEGHAPVAAPATAPAATEPGAANSGNGSLDQLPSVQPKTENAANSAIVRDLGDYRLEKQVLGEGAFGKVRLATSTRTSHRVAVKVIKRKKLNERAEVLLQRERKHHEKLRHRNIVRLHTFIMTPNKYYLVMEYCEGGDMLQFINSTTMLSDELARTLFRGLIDGIHFCHVLGIHHRDLKLENLMLTSRDEKTMAIKIADFGLSDLQTLPSSLSSTFCGSPLYAAPELMTAGAAPDGYDASKSDVWSCGVICYALLTSALPFDAEDISTLVRLIQRGVPNSPVPFDADIPRRERRERERAETSRRAPLGRDDAQQRPHPQPHRRGWPRRVGPARGSACCDDAFFEAGSRTRTSVTLCAARQHAAGSGCRGAVS